MFRIPMFFVLFKINIKIVFTDMMERKRDSSEENCDSGSVKKQVKLTLVVVE